MIFIIILIILLIIILSLNNKSLNPTINKNKLLINKDELLINKDTSPTNLNNKLLSNTYYYLNTNNKYVCMYAYYEKNDEYKNNLLYFLNNGLLKNVDYYIIINGNCTVNIPNLINIKLIKKKNKGFDFGAWAHCIYNYILKINKQYEYYIFINTSVRGPFFKNTDKITWLDKFLLLFNTKDIKMVGTTICILKTGVDEAFDPYIKLYKNKFKYDEPYIHIQSMFFILNNEAFNYLLTQNFFNEKLINSYNSLYDIILNYEIKLTQLILKNNWNINSIVPIYQNIDYRKQIDFIPHITQFTDIELIFLKNNLLWYNILI